MRQSVSVRASEEDGNDLRPQDLFSWSSPHNRNISTSGSRYFSINGGVTNMVNFNQNPDADLGDWFSEQCPQTHPYVQTLLLVADNLPTYRLHRRKESILDVIGYDLSQTSLSNISTRSFVQTGEHVMIGGFIVQGYWAKKSHHSCDWP